MDAADIVKEFALTTPDFSARIGSLEKIWTSPCTKVAGRFFYIRSRDGRATVDDLVDLAYRRIVNFAIPRSRVDKAKAEMQEAPEKGMDTFVQLVTEARDLFIKTHQQSGRSGELGELLLYVLMEWILNAPIVACKMYLKTSLQMPVHGADGVHLSHEGDCLVLYWGESKMHGTFASAVDDILDSVSNFSSNPEARKNEIRIINQNFDMSSLSADARTALADYFDPYAPESNKLKETYACFAGFDSAIYKSSPATDADYEKALNARIEKIGTQILEKTTAKGLQHLSFNYFLLPFPSVDQARERFQSKLWGR